MRRLPTVFIFPILIAGVSYASPAHAATVRIGGVAVIERELEGVFSGERWTKKFKGDDVYETEFVRTNEESKAEFSLVDKTAILIGPMTTIRFDRIVYNPNNSIRGIAVSARLGAARFQSGGSSAYLVRTPQADIQPLGTAFDLYVEEKKTTAVLRAGRIRVCTTGDRSNCKVVSRAGDVITITTSIEGPRPGGPTPSDFANRCLSASREACLITASYTPPPPPGPPARRSASRSYTTSSSVPDAVVVPDVRPMPRIDYRYRYRRVGTYYQRGVYRPHYPRVTYPRTPYPRTTYPRTPYPRATYPRATYPRATYPRATYPRATYRRTTGYPVR